MSVKKVAGTVSVTKSGTTKTFPINSISITRGRSEATKFAFTVFDPDGTYNPNNSSSAYYQYLTPELQPVGTPSKTVTINIYCDSDTKTYSNMIIMGLTCSASPEGGYVLNVSGADYSQVLFRNHQTKETFTNSGAKAIIGSILEDYGFTSYTLDFTDFTVIQMDFQQTKPINQIQTLLNEVGAVWRVDGTSFYAWVPEIGTATATYTDSTNIYSLAVNEQAIELVNKVTVCRVNKNADLAYSGEGSNDGWTTERVSGSFSGYFRNSTLEALSLSNCLLNGHHLNPLYEEIKWWKDELFLGSGWSCSQEANKITLMIVPINATHPYSWQFEVRGTPSSLYGSSVDPDASYTYRDEDSISAYGLLPAPNIESNFTVSNSQAQAKAEAFMREQGRLKRTVSLEAVINKDIEIGDTITVTEGVGRFTGDFLINSITTNIVEALGTDNIEAVQFED